MLKSYLLVALRNLKKQKLFSMINIIGMAVGMAGFAIFALTAGTKLNADKFHKNADRIYSIVQVLLADNKAEQHTAFIPAPVQSALRNDFAEIEDAVRIFPAGRMTLKRQQESFYENNILFVDPNFLAFFTFEMTRGNAKTALATPNAIVLSQAAASKYFGDENPLGKVLTLERNIDLTVTGITKNIPRTSSIRFEFLISMQASRSLSKLLDDWNANRHTTFVRLPEGYDKAQLEQRFPAFVEKYFAESSDLQIQKMYLFPLLDFRLNSEHITSFLAQSNRASAIGSLVIGAILLLIVCINFINMSTARYMYRVKEIGLRKVIGARRFQLIAQFLGESILLAFLALPIALLLFHFIYPIFMGYIGAPAALPFFASTANSIWSYPFLLKYLVITSLVVGIFSGFYPAVYLSAFPPVRVLQGDLQTGKKKRRGSKVMIVLQFTLAIIFIAFASVIKDQFDYLLDADFGFNKERVAAIELTELPPAKREFIKTEFARQRDVLSVSASGNVPVLWLSKSQARLPEMDKEKAVSVQAYGVDYNFVELLEMELVQGRSFSRDHGDGSSFVLNESAAQRFRWENPVGQQLTVGDKTGTVVGVVKDFVFGDIGFEMPPAAIFIEPENLNYVLLKYSPHIPFETLHKNLKAQWQTLAPDMPFDCFTLDGRFRDMLGLVNKIAGFFNLIGIAAVLFSCLGLLGLASYMVERRTKEIGIRKVLGASLASVIWTIIKEFIKLVAIANAIGLAIIYFGWQSILQTGLLFVQDISAGTYFFVIFISLFSALIAVCSQTLKAALANPVSALRHE